MRNYDYQEKWKKILTPQVVVCLITIYEYKGEQQPDKYITPEPMYPDEPIMAFFEELKSN